MAVGQKKISWLDLEQLEEDVKKVKICLNTSTSAIIGSSVRTGSVYFKDQHLIVFNLSLFERLTKWSPGYELMRLHEFLGAMGYPDQNFAISAVLSLKAFPNEILDQNRGLIGKAMTAEKIKKMETGLEGYLSRNISMSKGTRYFVAEGGASGGPGGGDPFTAEIKGHLIREIIGVTNLEPSIQSLILEEILDVDIEQSTLIMKKFDSGLPGLSYGTIDKKIVICYEQQYWNQIKSDIDGDHQKTRSEFVVNMYNLIMLLKQHPEFVMSLPKENDL